MIFLWVGLALLLVCGFIYALFKWIIPAIIKAAKDNKEKKKKKENEIPDEIIEPVVTINPVEKASKGSHGFLKKEEVTHSENYKEVAYVTEDAQAEQNAEPISDAKEEDAEFEQFLKHLENNNNKDIKTQIKSSSTKLKAIIMSGALQDKKYKD